VNHHFSKFAQYMDGIILPARAGAGAHEHHIETLRGVLQSLFDQLVFVRNRSET
jgi:hypothetical protein